MSALFFQSDTKQNNQYLKCADLLVRGNLTVPDGSATFKQLGTPSDGSITLPGKITVGAMPVPYTQETDRSTAVDTGSDHAFMINTANPSLAAHSSAIFEVNNTNATPNSHVLLTCQTTINGLIYNVCEVGSNVVKVQCSNVSAFAVETSSRIALRILDASAPA